MKKVLKIDLEGFFIEDVILEDEVLIPNNCIEIKCKDGFYKPKWNGIEWIEGATKEYIDNIINQPIAKKELELKVEALENENADLLLDSVKKDIRIEQNEFDIADLLLTMGGM